MFCGIEFAQDALDKLFNEGAKGQNMMYNAPINAALSRPQELFIIGEDGYVTVTSCVAPNKLRSPVVIDVDKRGELFAIYNGEAVEGVKLQAVVEPSYYSKRLKNGEYVRNYVTACGYDELNIIPWKGCAITDMCWFCGSNSFVDKDELSALSISREFSAWQDNESEYLSNLYESVSIAIKDECYSEHAHVILISGNLSEELLNAQCDIFANISHTIYPLVQGRAKEGIIAVVTPPQDFARITALKQNGVDMAVFNLEAGVKAHFEKYCPGKAKLGYEYFIDRLCKSVDVFGTGHVWTNFVLGLESYAGLILVCEDLAKNGIVSSANVLHLDRGSNIDCDVPCTDDVLDFFYRLNGIYKKHDFTPLYCAKALRTSLTNEVYDGRVYE